MSLAFSVALGLAVMTAQPQSQPSYASSKGLHKDGEVVQRPAVDDTNVPDNAEGGVRKTREPREGVAAAGADAGTNPASSPGSFAQDLRVSAIGDSVMLGASETFERGIGRVGTVQTLDAEIGFQASDVIGILRQRQAAGQLGEVVVVHVGNNGPLREQEFDEIMDILSDARKVVFVNVKVPRPWEALNNAVLAEGVERYPNAVLADWYGLGYGSPQLFWADGMHLRPEGGQAYTRLILQAIKAGR